MSLSDIKSFHLHSARFRLNKEKRCQDRASHRKSVSFYPHPYASVNLQVQRVKALRAQSQLTSSAPLVVVTSKLFEQPHCTKTW